MIRDIPDVKGQDVTVMGLGSFGGGTGVTRYLCNRDANVTVTDLKNESELTNSLAELSDLKVQYVLGEHREQDFIDADLVIVNPAVPMDSKYVQLARDHGVPLESELNLFVKLCPAPVIGITGTAGKSTTTAVTGQIFEAAGNTTWVGGNIGNSLLPDLEHIKKSHTVILEISSFQLLHLKKIKWSPATALVTNITPNHLDRHETFEHYEKAKFGIVEHQSKNDVSILNKKDPVLQEWKSQIKTRLWEFSLSGSVDRGAWVKKNQIVARSHPGENPTPVMDVDEIPLPGDFNVENILAATTIAHIRDIHPEAIREGIISFSPLPHHLDRVGETNGITFIDDSVSTSPDSSIAALDALSGNIVIILGGYDKGVSFEDLALEATQKTRAAVLLGETADQISRNLEKADPDYPFAVVDTLENAVEKGVELLGEPKGIVLLSPGTASYDMFKNYQQRGRRFKQAVQKIVQEHSRIRD